MTQFENDMTQLDLEREFLIGRIFPNSEKSSGKAAVGHPSLYSNWKCRPMLAIIRAIRAGASGSGGKNCETEGSWAGIVEH